MPPSSFSGSGKTSQITQMVTLMTTHLFSIERNLKKHLMLNLTDCELAIIMNTCRWPSRVFNYVWICESAELFN